MLISRHRIGVSTEVRRQQLSARQRFGTGPDKPSSSSAQSSLFELIRGISADFNVYSAFQSMSRSTRISVFSKRHQKQARLVRLRDYRCLHFRLEMNQLAKESIWALSGVSTHPHTHTVTEFYFIIMGNNSKQWSFPRAWFWKVNSIWEGDKVGCCDHHTLSEYSQRYNGSADSHHSRCMKMIMSQGRGRHVRFPWLEASTEGLIQHAKQFLCNPAYTNWQLGK